MGILDLLRPNADPSRNRNGNRLPDTSGEKIADLPKGERLQLSITNALSQDMRPVAAALQQLVALDMYRQGFPLAHVKAADTTGVVAAAIEALATERIAEDLVAGVHGQLADAAANKPAILADSFGTDHADDIVFYDQVRRAATTLGIPFDEGTNLDKLAAGCGWDREHMTDLVESLDA